MAWRDIDVTVVCDRLDIGVVTDIAASLATHPNVRDIEFRSDTVRWNQGESGYPCGLILGIEHAAANRWELDIWFVDEPDRQPDLAHLSDFSGG